MDEPNLTWPLAAVEVAGRRPQADIGQSEAFDRSRLNAVLVTINGAGFIFLHLH